MLYHALEKAAKKVPSPFPDEGATLFDSWLARGEKSWLQGRPAHQGLGANADYSKFMYRLGIPSSDFAFVGQNVSLSKLPHYFITRDMLQSFPDQIYLTDRIIYGLKYNSIFKFESPS